MVRETSQWEGESHSQLAGASNPGWRLRLRGRRSRSARCPAAAHWERPELRRPLRCPAVPGGVGDRYCAGVPGSALPRRAPPASASLTSSPERAVPLAPSSARRTEVAAAAGESEGKCHSLPQLAEGGGEWPREPLLPSLREAPVAWRGRAGGARGGVADPGRWRDGNCGVRWGRGSGTGVCSRVSAVLLSNDVPVLKN